MSAEVDAAIAAQWLQASRPRPNWSIGPHDAVAAAALAELPALGVVRLAALLRTAPAAEVYSRIRAGSDGVDLFQLASEVVANSTPDEGPASSAVAALRVSLAIRRAWSSGLRSLDDVRRDLHRSGCDVVLSHDPRLPPDLSEESTLPPVLYFRGPLDEHAARGWPKAVSIVGTRRASAAGREMARELGRGLAGRGIDVVSGLASGIDAAAHLGTLNARGPGRAFAVVATGPDRVYPAENAQLWKAVGTSGLIVSEVPPGTRPAPYRFPLRNRLIAAWGRVTIVVESHAGGGSLITAKAAFERNRTVLVVPGSPLHPSTEGTNRLFASEGVLPCTSVEDVLVALGWSGARSLVDGRPEPGAVGSRVLAALRWGR